ncbi:hypothetical protein ACFX2I_047101 [Malus domestica]
MAHIPSRLGHQANSVSDDEMSAVRARSGSHMQKRLHWFDLIVLGLGSTVVDGAFVDYLISAPHLFLTWHNLVF